MNDWIIFALLGLSALAAVFAAVAAFSSRRGSVSPQELDRLKTELLAALNQTRQDNATLMQQLGEMLALSQQRSAESQDKALLQLSQQLGQRQEQLQKSVTDMVALLDGRFNSFSRQNEEKLELMRTTMERRLTAIQEDNGKQLEQMRVTVDEKLQKTLEDRIGQSFKMVSERLEQVYKGLGEMQTLATGVGDLKKVLSNVKTRGILGEIQLGAILEQILAPEQYETNVATHPGSQNRVEYAVRLPGDDNGFVYLPIDAKFPGDAYSHLVDAYDGGNPEEILQAGKVLEQRVRSAAKDIHDKYVCPPNTTDFAILFLPFEGLYAEVVRRGLVETLQRDYKINIAGPTTMAALLNSLQMGFKTLAIQKRSGEVWNVLGAVKTEFKNFAQVLGKAQDKLRQADKELDSLVGVRTRQIERKLRDVSSLSEGDSQRLLGVEDDDEPIALEGDIIL